MAKITVLPKNNRDAKKHICPTPHLEGHVCSNSQGKALKKLMQKKKMNVEKFSEASSILVSTLNKIISGHSRLTTKGMLKAAKALQMSPLALAEACLNESRIFKAA